MNKVSTVTMLEKAENIKLDLPRLENAELHNELSYIRCKISEHNSTFFVCGCISMEPNNVSSSFKRAMDTMTNEEMAEYYMFHWTEIERYY